MSVEQSNRLAMGASRAKGRELLARQAVTLGQRGGEVSILCDSAGDAEAVYDFLESLCCLCGAADR